MHKLVMTTLAAAAFGLCATTAMAAPAHGAAIGQAAAAVQPGEQAHYGYRPHHRHFHFRPHHRFHAYRPYYRFYGYRPHHRHYYRGWAC